MKDDHTTNFHYLTYTFLLKGDVRMYFLSLGVKGLIARQIQKKKNPGAVTRKERELKSV